MRLEPEAPVVAGWRVAMSAILPQLRDTSASVLLASSGWSVGLAWSHWAADLLIGLALLVIVGVSLYFVRCRGQCSTLQ
jgi:hypothetical protein